MSLDDAIPKIFDKLDKLGNDTAVIKSIIQGNGQEGLCKKVERHDRYFYYLTGGWFLISVIFMIAVKVW